MARTTGPLFSFDASGSLGGAIVFSKWKGRNYVRQHAVPANPRSAGQLSVRALMAYTAAAWDGISDVVQAQWDAAAASRSISPFNAYTSANANRWTQFELPIHGPDSAAGTAPTLGTLSATGGKGIIEVSVAVTTAANMVAVAFFVTPAADTVIARTHLRLIKAGTTGPVAGTILHVPAGAHFARAIGFTAGGLGSDSVASAEVTVT